MWWTRLHTLVVEQIPSLFASLANIAVDASYAVLTKLSILTLAWHAFQLPGLHLSILARQ